MIKMNIPVIFQFLKDLSANNNREWFNEHKAEYEMARAEFDNFLATVIFATFYGNQSNGA